MPIHTAQNNIPEGDGVLNLLLPIPEDAALRSGTVAGMFVTYIYLYLLTDIFITLFIYNIFLLSVSICFFLQSHQKNGKVIYFIATEWLIGK